MGSRDSLVLAARPVESKRRRWPWIEIGFAASCCLALVVWWWQGSVGPLRPTVSPATTFLRGPMNPEGFVDYLEVLNVLASAGVTPENNFELVVRKVCGDETIRNFRLEYYRRLGIPPLPAPEDAFQQFGKFLEKNYSGVTAEALAKRQKVANDLEPCQYRIWKENEFPEVREWLKGNEAALNELVAAAGWKTTYYTPVPERHTNSKWRSFLMQAVHHHEHDLYHLLCGLQGLAMQRIGDGNVRGGWEVLQGMRRIGRLKSAARFQLHPKSAWILDLAATRGALDLALAGTLSAQECRKFGEEIRKEGAFPSGVADYVKIHRFGFLQTATDYYCEPEAYGGHSMMMAFGLGRKPGHHQGLEKILIWGNEQFETIERLSRVSDLQKRREELRLHFVAMRTEVDKDLPDRRSFSFVVQQVLGRERMWEISVRERAFSASMPSVKGLLDQEMKCEVGRLMTWLTFELQAYRLEQGRYPERLEDLVPQYVESVPVDLFTGKPIRYFRWKENCVLHSPGSNGLEEMKREAPVVQGFRGIYTIPSEGDDLVIPVSLAR